MLVSAAVALLLAGCGADGKRSSAAGPSGAASVTTTLPAEPSYPIAETAPAAAGAATGASTTTTTTTAVAAANKAPTSTTTATPAPHSPTTTSPPATQPHAQPEPAQATITIQGFRFDPPILRVGVGTRVTASNRDGATHTWSGDGGRWDSGSLEQGQSFTVTFDSAGTFTYRCRIHPSMTGSVTAGS